MMELDETNNTINTIETDLNTEEILFNGNNNNNTNLHQNEYSVDVSIEPNHECEIQEIKYDGEEIYKEPLTQSENLAMLISKIDFNEELNISYADDANLNNISKEAVKNSTKLAQKFHRNIFDKVKQSYDEICVLLDCLQIGYLNTNLLSIENSKEDESKYFEINDKILNGVLKKKNIEAAKMLIKKSLEKISSDSEYTNNRFHIELYRLRQYWRVKKVANKFIGDFSYRSIGCLGALKGNFEILKNDYNKQQQIDVSIPEEYEEDAFIRVQIISNDLKQKANNYDFKYSIFQIKNPTLQMPSYFQWNQQLENAQNSIYAKELFNQILREAFEFQTQLRPLIIGNSIKISLIQNVDLIISLEHNNYNNANITDEDLAKRKVFMKNFNYDNSFLELTLYHLLKKYFHQTFTHVDYRPITSVIAFNHPVKLAGVSYAKDYTIKRLCILQTIKDIAEHMFLKNRIMKILSQISRELSDPLIIIEPSLFNRSTNTDIRVTISSTFYEGKEFKQIYLIRIKNTRVTIMTQSTTITFTDNIDNLKSFILDQCVLHQTNLIQELCRFFNLTIITNGTMETPNSIYSVLLSWNSLFSKKIAIKLGPVNNIDVYVKKFNTDPITTINGQTNDLNKTNDNGIVSQDFNDDNFDNCLNLEWLAAIQKTYVKINISDSYPGRTLMNKFELFLADMAFS